MPRNDGFRIVPRRAKGGPSSRRVWDVYGPDGYAWLEIVAGQEVNVHNEWHPIIAIYDAEGNQIVHKASR